MAIYNMIGEAYSKIRSLKMSKWKWKTFLKRIRSLLLLYLPAVKQMFKLLHFSVSICTIRTKRRRASTDCRRTPLSMGKVRADLWSLICQFFIILLMVTHRQLLWVKFLLHWSLISPYFSRRARFPDGQDAGQLEQVGHSPECLRYVPEVRAFRVFFFKKMPQMNCQTKIWNS